MNIKIIKIQSSCKSFLNNNTSWSRNLFGIKKKDNTIWTPCTVSLYGDAIPEVLSGPSVSLQCFQLEKSLSREGTKPSACVWNPKEHPKVFLSNGIKT